MLDYINEREPLHILTVEDPIEFTFTDKKAYINQREIGLDVHATGTRRSRTPCGRTPTSSWSASCATSRRSRPPSTRPRPATWCSAPSTPPAPATTINRILDLFPPDKHSAIRQALANNLKAVVAQKLVKGLKKGRVPTNEIMIVNPTIRKLIIEGEDSKLPDAIRIGFQEGMVDFTENLRQLVERGDIDKATALEVAPEPGAAEDGVQGHQGGGAGHSVNAIGCSHAR